MTDAGCRPRATAGAEHDSAGTPWRGRELNPQPFAGDDGRADPTLTTALQDHAAGRSSRHDVVAALATARVLVAVAAAPALVADQATGLPADVIAEMALVTMVGADGRRILPVFTAQEHVGAWYASLGRAEAVDPVGPADQARPVPVEAARAAQAAVAEGCEVIVLDPLGPVPFVVPRPALWALGHGRAWLPVEQDDALRAAVLSCTAALAPVTAVSIAPGEPAECRVSLTVRPGLSESELRALLSGLQTRLTTDDVITERISSLEIRVVAG